MQNQIYIKAIIIIFLLFSFYLTVALSGIHANNMNSWTIGDWLISYENGFIRRGFIGFFVNNIHEYYGFCLQDIVHYIHSVFYFLYFFFMFLLIVKQNNITPNLLLIFSPFVFVFQIYDMNGGFRKDIFILFYFSMYVYFYLISKKDSVFYFFAFLFVVPVLVHEMSFFFITMLLIPFYLINNIGFLDKRNIYVLLSVFPSAIVFLLSVINKGNFDDYLHISTYVSINAHASLNSGAIEWIDKDFSYAFVALKEAITIHHYFDKYLLVILLSSIGFFFIRNKIKTIILNKISFLLLFISVLFMLVLFVVAIDWGRFIYLWFTIMFIISLLLNNDNKNITINIYYYIAIVLVYFLFWRIPHCCDPSVVAFWFMDWYHYGYPYSFFNFFEDK